MKRYYNGAALRGGWSFKESSAIVSPEMPTEATLQQDGQRVIESCTQMQQAALRTIMEKSGATVPQLCVAVGLLKNMDALKMAATEDDDPLKKQYQARRVLLRNQFAGVYDSGLYRRVQRFFHLPRDLAALRNPVKANGPYIPYNGIDYFPTPPIALTGKRNGGKFKIPLTGATWTELPPDYLNLEPTNYGERFTEAEKIILSNAMRQAQDTIRKLRRGESAAMQ